MRASLLTTITLAFLVPAAARADVISLSGAENSRNIAVIGVEDDRVTVALEVFIGDIEIFQDALPDEWYREDAPARDSEAVRLRRFTAEVLGITADGRGLPVRVDLAEPRTRVERFSPLVGMMNPWTRTVVPGPPADKRVLYLELTYAFRAGDRPASLTITPPMGEGDFARVDLGFSLSHRGVQVVDFSGLTEPTLLHLDWEDPWYSCFEKKNLRRWQQSGMMTFLYIEPYEVRHEMLMRIQDMMPLLDLGLRDDQWIEEDEFKAVESAIGAFLLEHSNVTIDGAAATGVLDRINFVQYTRRQTLFLTEPERLSVAGAMLGVVVTYFTEGIPQEVTMTWDLFTERVQAVPANAIDPAGPFPTTVTPADPVHVWTNFLKTYTIPTVDAVAVEQGQLPPRLPVLSLVLLLGLFPVGWALRTGPRRRPLGLGALLLVAAAVAWPLVAIDLPTGGVGADPDNEQSRVLVENLLRNIYRAFDFRDEEDVYDKLAVTVAGDLLTGIYLQNRRSFAVAQAGGAQARVQAIAIESVEPSRVGRGYRFDTTWTAGGSVGHWGHVHVRTNRYQALVTIEPENGAWKITGMEVLDETRLDPNTTGD